MNALVYHLHAFDSLVDSKLGERAQHIEEGQGRYVLDARDHLDVLRRKLKLTVPE
jgi:hypothetical protein